MKILQIILVGVAVTVTGAQAQSPRSSDRDALIGAWHLVRIDVPGADGKLVASCESTGRNPDLHARRSYVGTTDVSQISKRTRQ